MISAMIDEILSQKETSQQHAHDFVSTIVK